jgi:hypothetical protein
MVDFAETPLDRYLRFARRSMFLLLIVALTLGSLGIGFAFRPDDPMLLSASRMIPIVIAILGAGLAGFARRSGLRVGSSESETALRDEWRQTILARAFRVAFLILVIVQVPLAFCFTSLPVLRALLAMAVSTITIAVVTFAGTYLVLDRN